MTSERISFPAHDEPVGYVDDLTALLRASDELPREAVLYAEGGPFAADIVTALEAHAAVDTREVERGTTWPTPRVFHATMAVVATLRELAERHAAPEIADHLVVYRGGEMLMWAHDAGYGDVYLGPGLTDETRRRFVAALGPALTQR